MCSDLVMAFIVAGYGLGFALLFVAAFDVLISIRKPDRQDLEVLDRSAGRELFELKMRDGSANTPEDRTP